MYRGLWDSYISRKDEKSTGVLPTVCVNKKKMSLTDWIRNNSFRGKKCSISSIRSLENQMIDDLCENNLLSDSKNSDFLNEKLEFESERDSIV
jgi:predicted nuclease of restriction endonuclease-like (RecB) superfamily